MRPSLRAAGTGVAVDDALLDAARWLAPGAASSPATPFVPEGWARQSTTPPGGPGGLVLEDRWAAWERRPDEPGGDDAVAVHRRDS